MKTYHCNINGRNFLIELEGKTEKCGFYKWVCVKVDNEFDAELRAVEKVRDDASLNSSTRNPKENPPMLYLEEIYEGDEEEERANDTGFVFYPEKKWWQFWK